MEFFTTNEIKPNGWIQKQLKIQAEGLNGNLDKMWRDVKESKWIGGDAEGWERVPYWLDGFIPLAFLLDDKDMQARAKRYIDSIISRQNDDGWLCPCSFEERGDYDIWGLFIILKALVVWQECSNDDRVEEVIYKALKNAVRHIQGHTVFCWGASRWYECLIPIKWLYKKRPEKWLIDLAKTLKLAGFDISTANPYYFKRNTEWNYYGHVVNVAMSLKGDALYNDLIKGKCDGKSAKKLLKILDAKHGTAIGHFTGDECLSGNSPSQGTELCGVVEAMYSYEHLLALTGDAYFGDRLEKLAFNGLPGSVSEDFWTHQYDQMVNQPACYTLEKDGHFTTNNRESNLFGLEPNFGCCTANFGQGFPKLCLSSFLKDGNDIRSAVLVPASVTTKNASVTLSTDYPFNNKLRYDITAKKEFNLLVRIPNFVKKVTVNGEEKFTKNGWLKLGVNGDTSFDIEFTYSPSFEKRPNGAYALNYGNLTLTLPIKEKAVMKEYTRDGVERKFPYCDYEFLPTTDWQYAFNMVNFDDTVTTQNPTLQVKFNPNYSSAFSHSNPPLTISVAVNKIDWKSKKGFKYVPQNPPKNPAPLSKTEFIDFVPYACTYLKMTELPVCKD